MKSTIVGRATSNRSVLLLGVAAASLMMPGVANAQAAPPAQAAEDATPADGNEIVVTATKREQTLQSTPVAVTVTTADAIERAQIRDIQGLSTLVPSLRTTQLQSSISTYFSIRGFGNGANNPGIETSVAVFVDGVYRSRSASQIGDLPDIQRVEVLRGPQSTLFGKNASAGVISIVTKAPQFKLGGNFEATYGNFNALTVKGVITGPLSETVAVSLAGGYNRRDGYVTDTGYNGKSNGRNRYFVRGQMLFEPTSDLKIRLIADYDKIDENCCAVFQLANGNPVINALTGRTTAVPNPFLDQTRTNFPSNNKVENYGASAQIDYNFGNVALTSITSYRRSNALTSQDSDFSSGDFLGSNTGDIRLKTFTQELRLASKFDGPLNFLIGGYYYDENVAYKNALTFGRDFRNFTNIASGGGVTALETSILRLPLNTFHQAGQGIFDDFKMHDKSYSAFGNVDFEVGDLTLTAGVNYTKDSKTVTSNTVSTDSFSALNLPLIVSSAINTNVRLTVASQLGLAPGTVASDAQVAFFQSVAPAGYTAIVNGVSAQINPLLGLRVLQFLPPFLNFPNAVESGKLTEDNFSYTLRAAYKFNNHINGYVSYATGYKPASYNLSRDSRPFPSDLAKIQAVPGLATTNLTTGSRYAPGEKAKVFEVGLKGNWGVVSMNFAAFKQSIDNFQSNVFTGTGFALASAGKQSTYGFEFEGTAHPVPELTLSMAVTYLKPKYDSFVNSALGDASGTVPAGIPPISATFGAMWNHALANDDHIILRTDFHYEAPVQVSEGLPAFIQRNPATGAVISYQPAFDAARPFRREVNELNASMTYAMSMGLELSIWARNLLNDRYITTIFDVPAQTGNIAGYTNAPRTFGGSVRYRF